MMRKGFIYAYLQFKRTVKYLPLILLITVVLCLSLSIGVRGLVEADTGKAENEKLQIGVVGEFTDSYLEFGVSALQTLDSSRFSMDILEMSESEAQQALADGEVVGYVLIPEGYIIDAVTGEVGQLTFVTRQTGIDMFTLFKEEVLKLVGCLVVESQKGVYSMEDILVDYQVMDKNPMDHVTALSTGYVGMIFNRNNVMKTEVIGVSDGLSFGGYMFSGIAVLLVLLCGISCCPLFIRRDMALPKLLRANQYDAVFQIGGEYAAFFAAMLINGLLLLFGMFFGLGNTVEQIPELTGGLPGFAALAVKLLPMFLAVTAMQFLLFEIADSVVSGVLLQFLGVMGLAYISGCLYPISFFPQTVRNVANLTPPGLARRYFAAILSDGDSGRLCLGLILCALFLLSGAVLLRHRRTRAS